jgi:calcium/calmodulin-dependent protein kinase I
MELVEAKELFEVINDVMADNGHFTEENARTIFAQILNAIKYMHAHGVCHRDLKPNNILAKEDGS